MKTDFFTHVFYPRVSIFSTGTRLLLPTDATNEVPEVENLARTTALIEERSKKGETRKKQV